MKRVFGLKFIISVVTCMCFIIFLFWLSLETVVFDKNFYKHQFLKLNLEQKSDISGCSYINNTQVLLKYIQDKRDDIDIKDKDDTEVFTDREKEHMKDVKNLYLKGRKVSYILLLLVGIGIFSITFIAKKQAIKLLMASFTFSLVVLFTFMSLITIGIILDFTQFWNAFHEVIFTNDLWLLNSTDTLIRMFPHAFFMKMIQSILIKSALGVLIIWLLIFLLYKYNRNRQMQQRLEK